MILHTTKLDSKTVTGWCFEPSDAQVHPTIELLVDGQLLAKTRADVPLCEIHQDTTSDRHIGFSFELPATLRDGSPHHIEIREAGRSVKLAKVIDYADSRIAPEQGLFGEYRGFDRGALLGWACRDGETVLPVVRIDGEVIPTHAMPDTSNALRARHGFSALVPPKYYDGKKHRVELRLLSEEGQEHLLGDDVIAPSPAMRKLQRWRQTPRYKEATIVDSLRITGDEVSLTVVGEATNKRAVLRLGHRRLVLERVSPPPADGRPPAAGQYTALLPEDANLLTEYALFTPALALQRTFDVRMDDETGRRPSYLPTQLVPTDAPAPTHRDQLPSVRRCWASELREAGAARLTWFSALARETHSREARDVLALAVSAGKHNYQSLIQLLQQARTQGAGSDADLGPGSDLWLPGLCTLAQVVYSQRLEDKDFNDAYSLYDYAERTFGMASFPKGADRSYYADLLTQRGYTTKAIEVLSYLDAKADRAYSQQFLKLNAWNPHTIGNSEALSSTWFSALNELFRAEGFNGVATAAHPAPAFYALTGESAIHSAGPQLPLVTVIMPIYEPNAATDVAIRSLLEQTWKNLEIIIIDDASPAVDESGKPTRFREHLQRWAEHDQRIRLVLCEENRGAYSVRNDAFRMAKGEFVTVADKDDWHHPQRIEYQTRDLMTHPGKHANIVNWARVDEQMRFQIRWGPDRVVHPSFACIMFRREDVLDRLGVWDAVRKSADNEYRQRFELVFGEKLTPQVRVPLAFSLLGDGNLTSSDFGLGYRHPDREVYQWAYSRWHQQIQNGQTPRLEGPAREFYAPPAFRPDRADQCIPHYDVVFISEFGLLGGAALAAQAEIAAAAAAGLKVAIMPLRGVQSPTAAKRRLAPEIEQLWLDGAAEWITWNTEATADLAVLCWPALMGLKPAAPLGLKADGVTIVANQLPTGTRSQAQNFDVQQVDLAAEQVFGVAPEWAAQSPAVEEAIRAWVSPERILEEVWTMPSSAPPSAKEHPSPGSGRAVIGRILDEDEQNWPAPEVICDAYPADEEIEVLLVSKVRLLQKRGVISPQGTPRNWTVLPAELQTYDEYLGSLDFLVHYGAEPWDPHTEGTVVRAMERGVVCLLHPALKPVYGAGALYAAPGEIRDTLQRVWRDPEAMNHQRVQGREFLAMHRDRGQYVERLRTARRSDSESDGPVRGRHG